MEEGRIHIVEVMADSMSITYFNLFAEQSKNHPEIKLTFVCLNNVLPPIVEDMKERGCDCFWVKFDNTNRIKSWVSAYFQLKKLFKQLKPDVVHSHLFDDGVPAMLAAKHTGVRKRVHTKQSTTFNWFYAPKAVFLDRLINKTATHLIAVSNEAKQFLIEKEKADPQKIHMIHHGISFENLKKASEEEIRAFKTKFNIVGKKVIGTVSRYIKWKGYIQFIEAASILKEKYPDVVFLGVGSGSQEEELRTLIKEKDIEKQFILTGWIEKKYIPAVFHSIDIYFHAAYMEPFGFVIPEAMVNKVPIVTTPTGSAADGLQHMESAYIAPYFNVEELAKGMEYFLTHDSSSFVEKAYLSAKEKFTIEKMWNKHLELYRSENFETIN
ncbi:MAG: glycosyltransferase family 4 protein [Vicingus serpentipes]|nr:glycosyltransferase family 4 protein [Vicingus serpentipes]